jgi:hypothetical protein
MNLKESIGVDIGFCIAGLFGALLMMSSNASMNVGRTLLATVGGAASANYVTPLILHITKLDNDPTHSYAIAFLLGYGGLRMVELLTNKILPTDAPAYHRQRRR